MYGEQIVALPASQPDRQSARVQLRSCATPLGVWLCELHKRSDYRRFRRRIGSNDEDRGGVLFSQLRAPSFETNVSQIIATSLNAVQLTAMLTA